MSLRRKRLRMRLATLMATLLTLGPQLAEACAVCGAGREEESRVAFIITTAFMSLLPLLLIGGLVVWLRSRFRMVEEERSTLRPGPAAAPEA